MKYAIEILLEKIKEIEYTKTIISLPDNSNIYEIKKVDKKLNQLKQAVFQLKHIKQNKGSFNIIIQSKDGRKF